MEYDYIKAINLKLRNIQRFIKNYFWVTNNMSTFPKEIDNSLNRVLNGFKEVLDLRENQIKYSRVYKNEIKQD